MRVAAPALACALIALVPAADAGAASHGHKGRRPVGDRDRDGLSNRLERKLGTNPRRKDTDRDYWNDGREVRLGSNPRDRRSRPKKPDTKIASAPKPVSASSASSFGFQSSVPASRFECQVDGGAWKGCPAASSFGLADGGHRIAVRALNAEGWRDPTPASYSWSTDTRAPVIRIASAPAPFVASTSATFRFDVSEQGAKLECRRDGAAWRACTSPVTETSLAQGAHSFAVRGSDAAGNTSPAVSPVDFTVDTIAPDTTVTAVPSSTGVGPFAFSSTEPGTFECRVDSGLWAACASPTTYTGLSSGGHTFRVRARDLAGNLDSSPPRVSFRIG